MANVRKTILVSAYGCEPFRGSEAGVGWNWVLQMARSCDLHVIARANDQEKIEANLPGELAGAVTFHYYDCPRPIRALKHGDRGLYLYYFFWQCGIMPLARRILREQRIDYTMHLTFGSFWMPTFVPFLGRPFIWGPMGGGDVVPKSLLSALPPKERLVRRLSHILVATSSANPLVAVPSRRAWRILCRTESNYTVVPARYRSKATVILETAMEREVLEEYRHVPHSPDEPVRVIYVGRLIPLKNLGMGIRAFERAMRESGTEAHLTLVGDGPERDRLERLAESLGMAERVTFTGKVPREKALDLLSCSDVLLFPSMREGGSWALMEGMAAGLPVVCLDWTGMRTIVDRESGVLVAPGTLEETLDGLARGLGELLASPDLRDAMGRAARRRVEERFTWDAKGDFFRGLIYGEGEAR